MLNYNLLKEVQAGFGKKAYVDPSMMGGDPAAGGAPMDPAMMGGDPAAGGAPMDPAMMGMDPAMMGMDPSMMGGDPAAAGAPPAPPPGLDQAMAGMVGGGAPAGDPSVQGAAITLTPDELIKFMSKLMSLKTNGGIEGQGTSNDMAEIRQSLSMIAERLNGQGGGSNNELAEIKQSLTQIAAALGGGGRI